MAYRLVGCNRIFLYGFFGYNRTISVYIMLMSSVLSTCVYC